MTIKECVAQLERLKSIYMDAKDIGNFDEYIAALAMAIKILEGSPIEMKPMSDDELDEFIEQIENLKNKASYWKLLNNYFAPVLLEYKNDDCKCSNCEFAENEKEV